MKAPDVTDIRGLDCGHGFMAHADDQGNWCVHHGPQRATIVNAPDALSEIRIRLYEWHAVQRKGQR